MMDCARITDDDGMRRDITINKGTGSNQDIVSDGNLPDDRGINTDTHTTADSGVTLSRSPAFLPDGHPFMKMAVLTQDGIPVYGNIVGVSQIEPLTNPRATRNLESVLSRMNTEQCLVKRSDK